MFVEKGVSPGSLGDTPFFGEAGGLCPVQREDGRLLFKCYSKINICNCFNRFCLDCYCKISKSRAKK